MGMDRLVSVVIPTRNRPEKLLRAVGSVCLQTYNNIEIIIIDDGSGKIFVRYRSRDLADPLAIGDRIRVQKCRARIYSGILEIRLERSGRIIKLPESHAQYP